MDRYNEVWGKRGPDFDDGGEPEPLDENDRLRNQISTNAQIRRYKEGQKQKEAEYRERIEAEDALEVMENEKLEREWENSPETNFLPDQEAVRDFVKENYSIVYNACEDQGFAKAFNNALDLEIRASGLSPHDQQVYEAVCEEFLARANEAILMNPEEANKIYKNEDELNQIDLRNAKVREENNLYVQMGLRNDKPVSHDDIIGGMKYDAPDVMSDPKMYTDAARKVDEIVTKSDNPEAGNIYSTYQEGVKFSRNRAAIREAQIERGKDPDAI